MCKLRDKATHVQVRGRYLETKTYVRGIQGSTGIEETNTGVGKHSGWKKQVK